MSVEKTKARYYPGYCLTACGGDIVELRHLTGHIFPIFTALSIVAVKAHVSIRADQSQNASKVDRKKAQATLNPCALAPWRSSDCAAADTEKAVLVCGELLSTVTRPRSGRGESLPRGKRGKLCLKRARRVTVNRLNTLRKQALNQQSRGRHGQAQAT